MLTGWVAGGDGLLVMDRNHDGAINDGLELFGEGTTLANGTKATNGYAALAEMDSNGDGHITSADARSFTELMVWVDGNSDGVSDASELRSLTSLGITDLNLHAQGDGTISNGNIVGLASSYTTGMDQFTRWRMSGSRQQPQRPHLSPHSQLVAVAVQVDPWICVRKP